MEQSQAIEPLPADDGLGLLTVAEAAGVLRLSVKTLANWRSRGVGPKFCRLGARVLYTRAALGEYVAANMRG